MRNPDSLEVSITSREQIFKIYCIYAVFPAVRTFAQIEHKISKNQIADQKYNSNFRNRKNRFRSIKRKNRNTKPTFRSEKFRFRSTKKKFRSENTAHTLKPIKNL